MRAAEADAAIDQWGVMCPAILPVESTRNLLMTAYPRMIEILQLLGSSSFSDPPSEADFNGPLAAEIEQYLATDSIDAERPGQAVPPGLGCRRQRLRQPPGAVRAVLRQRPVDPRPRDGGDLSEGRGDGAGAGVFGPQRRRMVEFAQPVTEEDRWPSDRCISSTSTSTCATPSGRSSGTRTCSACTPTNTGRAGRPSCRPTRSSRTRSR